ncbi:MAG: HigA family addiction module antitoxin [Verrucomicrobiia bacterium]|jgi:addiction module HigA family antidote
MTNQFEPNYAVPPGATLLETIEELGMSQSELAQRMGRPLKTINEIINGKAAITPETALQLEKVVGIPASFWNNAERHYREILARRENNQKLAGYTDWLKQFPVREMAKLGWIPSGKSRAELVQVFLQHFGIASPEQWTTFCQQQQGSYRKSPAFKSAPGALSAWLRQGEVDAQKIECAPFDEAKFRSALIEVRKLTVKPPQVIGPEMKRLCAESGVAFVFVPEVGKTHVSGFTRWLTSTKALIQQSLRHKSDDHLWFTFFHEAGHILLHGKKDTFLEVDGQNDIKEEEANRFACDFLIPPAAYSQFVSVQRSNFSAVAIAGFARRIGVSPGIIVGRLQKDGHIPWSMHNRLKLRLRLVVSDEG